jgi:hypothetical protein
MDVKKIYEEAEDFSKEDIFKIIERNQYDELMVLPFNIGESFPDWEFAQEICIKLTKNEDADIRANAIMGLAYTARTKRKLSREIIIPIITKEYKENTQNKGEIEDAIEDINIFLKWDIKIEQIMEYGTTAHNVPTVCKGFLAL